MFVNTVAPALLALAARTLALPSERRDAAPSSVWESIEAAPSAWSQDAVEADAEETLELHIQLAQQNMVEFEQLALAVSSNLKMEKPWVRQVIASIDLAMQDGPDNMVVGHTALYTETWLPFLILAYDIPVANFVRLLLPATRSMVST